MHKLFSILSVGLFRQMFRSATPVALAALGGAMTEHAGIMNIGMDGMILMGAFTAVAMSLVTGSAAVGVLAAVLVGMFEVYGLKGNYQDGISKDYYFDGLLVAMIMRYNPAGIIPMSFLFAFLKVGAAGMELNAGVPGELYRIIQAIIIFFLAAESGVKQFLSARKAGADRA